MAKKTVEQMLKTAQDNEDRQRAYRIRRIKRAIDGGVFLDGELYQIEQVVFGAFGRTKLS